MTRSYVLNLNWAEGEENTGFEPSALWGAQSAVQNKKIVKIKLKEKEK